MRSVLLAISLLLAVLHADVNAADLATVRRTDLEKHEVPGSKYVVVTTLVEIDPGAAADFHTHPGIETGYVFSGSAVFSEGGKADLVHEEGTSFSVPAGVVHRASNNGSKTVRMILVYVVEKDKPLRSPATPPR